MKIKIMLSLSLILMGFMVVAQHQQAMEKNAVMIENESRYGFDQTIEKLSAAITDQGWKITSTLDLQETMKKNGKTVLPVKVIELCNPDHAFNILGDDNYRNVSPMLPCRISVYEKADGKTYISRMNAPAFASMVGGEGGKTMVQAFEDTEVILKDFVK